MEGEVSGIVQQWPILAIFLAGGAASVAGWKLWGPKPEPRHDGNGHADLRELIKSGFEDVKDRIGEVRQDLRDHVAEDRERFEKLQWDGQTERRSRERADDRQWKRG